MTHQNTPAPRDPGDEKILWRDLSDKEKKRVLHWIQTELAVTTIGDLDRLLTAVRNTLMLDGPPGFHPLYTEDDPDLYEDDECGWLAG